MLTFRDGELVCAHHHRKFKFYCTMHDEPCCDRCHKRTHNKCLDVLKLSCIHNVESSAAFSELEDEIDNLTSNMNSNEENKKSFLNHLLREKMEVLQEIETNRDIWNDKLDQIQIKLENELTQVFNTMREEVDGELDEIQYLRHLVDSSKTRKDEIKTMSNDVQCFLNMKRLSKAIRQSRSKLESLSSMSSLHDINLNFSPNVELLDALDSLGTISLDAERKPMSIEQFHMKKAQTISYQNKKMFSKARPSSCAQSSHLSRRTPRAINRHEKYEPFNTTTDSSSSEGDEHIFMDRDNRRLILYDANGRFDGCINLTVKPNKVHIINEKELLVIHGNPPEQLTVHLDESKSSRFAISSQFQACIIIALFLSLVLYISLYYENYLTIFNQSGMLLSIFIVNFILISICRFLFDGMSQTASNLFKGKIKNSSSGTHRNDTSMQIAKLSNLLDEFQNNCY
ncbi:unnamed protein product [Mytilus coruscus]|uniref:B box-type domain-containing protein n=1 Tax=Mytilus coruscus TaxID=42192 RepID=A0A6J8BLM7_MYTCO|nr:unnamed protein product [Mytilus coruscus]